MMSDSVVVACRGLLFDCDGVLADSDSSVTRAWTRWASRYDLDAVAVNAMVHGRRAADTVALLIDPAGQGDALASVNAYELEDAVTVRAVPGAPALLAGLAAETWAVVTSGTMALCTTRLEAAGLPVPRVLITADDVADGKPDPAGYLAAAAALGIPVARTIVLEDSPSGVVAARRAGVGAVVGVGDRALETDADVVVEDLRGLSWAGDGLRIERAAIRRISARQ